MPLHRWRPPATGQEDDETMTEPTYELLVDDTEIAASQRRLEALVRARASWTGTRKLGFHGGNVDAELAWIGDERIWYSAPSLAPNRWENGFGVEDPRDRPMLSITLWINPQKSGVDRRANAAFVRDDAGHVLLVHTGRLGGGKKGVGQRAFLEAFDGPRITVGDRMFVVVADLESPSAVADIASYVRAVAAFKAEVGAVGDDGADPENADDGEGDEIPFLQDAAPSYWKVSPGANADHWKECLAGSYIGVGWTELGDLRGLDRDGFVARMNRALEEHPKWTRAGVEQVWRFINIPVGARIVANEGTRRVLGIGTVIGPYEYAPDDDGHHLPVRWDDTRVREIERLGWRKTLIQIKRADFEEIVAAPSPSDAPVTPQPRADEQAAPPERLSFDGIVEQLEEEGLFFPDELVAAYLLALQTKRLVILSGISGTGKTQLALSIARIFQPPVSNPSTRVTRRGGVRIRVQPYMLEYHRFIVPSAIVPLLRTPGSDASRLQVNYAGKQTESLKLSRAGSGATTMALLFSGGFRKWFDETFEVGDEFLLDVADEDPPSLSIRPAGESDGAPSPPTEAEVVVAVRPDWTDNRGLLGYYNPITSLYQVTPFLRVLLAAADEQAVADREGRPARPFFVVLDEMNLARVEHYFSDFLSSIESGKPLHLHDDDALAEGEVESGVPIPRQLVVPRNLFFTGTVNVDESTYIFSPKVLDRAFTLEFNEVDLESFGAGATESDAPSRGLRLELFDGVLATRSERSNTKQGVHDWIRFRELEGGALAEVLLALQSCLEPHHRHFGYRVASEIARFVGLAAQQASRDAPVLWDALDIAVLAKVLPKLHGTQQELEDVVRRLFACAVDPKALEANERDWAVRGGRLVREDDGSPSARLPRTAAKLWRMRERLRRQGFASFIE